MRVSEWVLCPVPVDEVNERLFVSAKCRLCRVESRRKKGKENEKMRLKIFPINIKNQIQLVLSVPP